MNRQDTVQKDNQPSLIEDLAINNQQAAEVKGGPVSGAIWSGVYDHAGLTDPSSRS
jgi:hypothetical protein